MFDDKTDITVIYLTNGTVQDINTLGILPIEVGSYYVMDKGYIDFDRLHPIDQSGTFYVTRAYCT